MDLFGHKSDIGSNCTVLWPSVFTTGYFSFATTFIPGSKYLLPRKIVNSITDIIVQLTLDISKTDISKYVSISNNIVWKHLLFLFQLFISNY